MHKKKRVTKLSFALLLSILLVLMPLQTLAYTTNIPLVKVIVTFKTQIDPKVVEEMEHYNADIRHEGDELLSVSASVPSNVIPYIQSFNSVKTVEYDAIMTVKEQTIDWGIIKTNTPAAWNHDYTGKGIKVAILDTGISAHEDLVISGGKSMVSYTTSYADDHGHGTHVAGTVGAKDNGIGSAGVAPDSELYAVKVLGKDGSGSMSDIVAGIDWAIANDMDIINMSLGSQSGSIALQDAVIRAKNAGVIVVVAAGNDGNANGTGDTVDYPGKYEEVITVGATDSNNKKASFSSAGPSVDVSAPGVSIYSTLNTGKYGYKSGTSMATPYVAGVIALYKEAYPNYNAEQIELVLKENAIDLGVVGQDNLFGVGLVQSPTSGSVVSPIVPTTPLNFRATEISYTTASFAWDKVEGASTYELKRNGTTIYRGPNTSFTESKLVQGTKYTYTLVTKGHGGTSQPATLSINTLTPALKATAKLTVTPTTNTAKATWSKVTYATAYELKRNGVIIYSGPLTTFQDTNLTPGTAYTYELAAKNASGQSIPVRTTVYTKTNPITNLKESHTYNSAKLTWNGVQGATYYQVKDKKSKKVLYKGANTSAEILKLSPGTAYTYEVYAGNTAGVSTAVLIDVKTTQILPTATKITALKPTQNVMTITWSKVSNAKTYEVKRNGVVVYSGTAVTFKDTKLTPGVEYTYSVTAKNEVGSSPSVSAKKFTLPSTPTGLTKTNVTSTATSLKWNPVNGATYYILKRDNKIIYKGTATNFTDKGLQAGKNYKYTITAGNTVGTSAASTVLLIQTVQVAPATPNVTKTTINKKYVTLNWSSIYNATKYTVKKNGVVIYNGSLKTFKDTNVKSGASYTYTITASNVVGSSGVKTITVRVP